MLLTTNRSSSSEAEETSFLTMCAVVGKMKSLFFRPIHAGWASKNAQTGLQCHAAARCAEWVIIPCSQKLGATLAREAGAGLLSGCSSVAKDRHIKKVHFPVKVNVCNGETLVVLGTLVLNTATSKMTEEGKEMLRDPVT